MMINFERAHDAQELKVRPRYWGGGKNSAKSPAISTEKRLHLYAHGGKAAGLVTPRV